MKKDVADFLSQNCVGVLATTSIAGSPQVASVFFITDDQGGLIFKSRVASEHVVSLRNSTLAAIAVYNHKSDYINKMGVQLKGTISRIVAADAMETYVAKYAQQFHGSLEKFDPVEILISPNSKSTLFRFQIDEYKFTDSYRGIAQLEYERWLDCA